MTKLYEFVEVEVTEKRRQSRLSSEMRARAAAAGVSDELVAICLLRHVGTGADEEEIARLALEDAVVCGTVEEYRRRQEKALSIINNWRDWPTSHCPPLPPPFDKERASVTNDAQAIAE
jgi:hypothetical protein